MDEKERIPINECQFNTREFYLIRDLNIPGSNRAKVEYLDEMQNFTAQDLLKVSGIGTRSLRAIRKVLAHHGLCLRGDFLAHSEEEKKLIMEMPQFLFQIKYEIDGIDKKLNWLMEKLDTMHSNMMPLD